MKISKLFSALIMLFAAVVFTGCPGPDSEPEITPDESIALSDGIVGKWLLGTSTDKEFTVYEFKKSQKMEMERYANNILLTGTGAYFTNDKESTLSGRIVDERESEISIDWMATKVQLYQIDIDIYGGPDGNQFVTSSSIHKILGEQEAEYGSVFTPDYRKFAGTSDCSGFTSMDESILKVNSSGEIECVGAGSTFVTFNTSVGRAVIKITVASKIMTFSENIIGTWVTDNKGYIWEKDVFGENGYFYGQWSREGIFPTSNESAQGTYTIDEGKKYIVISAETPYNMKITSELRVTKIDKYSFDTDVYASGDKTGTFYYQRVLSSITISPKDTDLPDYKTLVEPSKILGYSSHDENVATVDKNTGMITGVANGITYIDVITAEGTGVVEVNVNGGPIPYEFHDYLGKPYREFKELIGTAPNVEGDGISIFNNVTNEIDMIGVSYDTFTELVYAISIYYNSNVNTSDITSILNASFIPYESQSTATYKAYMDADDLDHAKLGVTWDIPKKTLVYVKLPQELFTDYSILIGMTRNQVVSKMGRQPDSTNAQSQSFFFFDNSGVIIVSAYYTDFIKDYDTVHSVVTMFDDKFSVEQITKFLKRKYPFYPEYSTDDELVFISQGNTMEICYMPKEKMVMYISFDTSSTASSRSSIDSIKDNLKIKSKSN